MVVSSMSISILNCTIWSHFLFTKIAHMCMYVPFPFFHNHSTEWQTFFQMRKSTYNTCTNLSNDLWNCSFNRILIINVIAALFCKYTPQLNSNTTIHTHRCVITVSIIRNGQKSKKVQFRKNFFYDFKKTFHFCLKMR